MINRYVVWALSVLCVALLVAAALTAYRIADFRAVATRTNAKVVDRVFGRAGLGISRSGWTPVVEFTDSTGTRRVAPLKAFYVGAEVGHYERGDSLVVLYAPSDALAVHADEGVRVWSFPMILGIAGWTFFAMLLYSLGFGGSKRKD